MKCLPDDNYSILELLIVRLRTVQQRPNVLSTSYRRRSTGWKVTLVPSVVRVAMVTVTVATQHGVNNSPPSSSVELTRNLLKIDFNITKQVVLSEVCSQT